MCAAEYMAASEASWELVWLHTLLRELNFEQSHATPLLCNNSAAMLLCGDQAFHNRVKHLDIKYHWIHERIEKEEMVIGCTPTSGNVVDILTKALPGPRFVTLQGCLGCYIFIRHWTYLSFCLSFPISIHSCYHLQIILDCLVHISLSFITPISDLPLYYLVAVCLLSYQCQGSYLV